MASSNILEEENVLSEKKDGADLWFQNDLLPKGQLFAAMFELTFRCNEKCKHCYCVKDKEKEELSTEEIKKVITDLHEMNSFELTFTGGDMFVRKDAFDILKYAKSLGFLINIFTNGVALTDSDFLTLKSLNPKSIHFSLYSDKSEEHDNFTGLEGSFLKTTDAIKKCIMLGLPTNIKTCVMDWNASAIGGILILAKEFGATAHVSMSLSAKNDGDTKNTALRLKKVEDYANVMKTVNENIEIHCSNDYRILRSSLGAICGAGIRSININPYGDVFPCNSLLIKCGNVREKSIRDIWENSNELSQVRSFMINKIKGCENCPDLKYCNFCPGSALTEMGDPLTRYGEACILTQAKKLCNS